MSDIHTIKNLRNNHGHSVNKINKDLNINWRTAKKYADHNQLPKESVTSRRGMMYQEKWGEIVSGWLIEDYRLKKKSRRTALAIFKELKELGFEESYQTVCSFIECWKDTHQERTDRPRIRKTRTSSLLEVPTFQDSKLFEHTKSRNTIRSTK